MADGSDASLMIRCEKRSLLEFKSHKIFWNRYLSWFYVQGKELGKTFVQEKPFTNVLLSPYLTL
jgi:hypothetical protein